MPRTPATTTHVSRKELVAYANYMDSYLGDLRAAIAVMDREKLDDIYVIAWQSAVDCLARAKAFRSRLSEACPRSRWALLTMKIPWLHNRDCSRKLKIR